MNAQQWMNNQQVYDAFGIKPKVLANLADEGKIERRYVGRKPLFRATSIESHIEKQVQHLADRAN